MVIFIEELVVYNKEDNQIVYKIIKNEGNKVLISGVNYRKIMEVASEEVTSINASLLEKENLRSEKYISYTYKKINHRGVGKRLGTVMHFDSDKNYLIRCEDLYKSMNIYCYPVLTSEEELKNRIEVMDCDFIPDVLVITGHDYYDGDNLKDLNSYKNSLHFTKAVLAAKRRFPESVIVAGACQSNFEALIASGANFASSPKRVNVHVYDPVIIAIYVCSTSFRKIIDFEELEKHIEGLREGFGGVETLGKMKMLY